MGPEVHLRSRAETLTEASARKDCVSFVQELDDKHMRFASNHENTFDVGAPSGEKNEEVSESSSSFGDTISEYWNRAFDSSDEAVSKLNGDASSELNLGGSTDIFRVRKKRLTSHWRRFIQPLLWRCKWVELQIQKFESQANKYDKLIAENNKRKQAGLKNFAVGLGASAKSIPFPIRSQKEKVMKRRKRKRLEDLDTKAFMAQHNLFSYYASQRSTHANVIIDDDRTNLATSTDENIADNGELGVSNQLLSLDFRDDDNSMGQILWKIGLMQSQVREMKRKLGTIMTENDVSSTEKLSLFFANDVLTGSVHKSSSPTHEDHLRVDSSHIASEITPACNNCDQLMPESAALSYAEATHLPDTNDCTDHPKVDASRHSNENGIIIYNRRGKKTPNDSGGVKVHPIQKLQVPKEKNGSTNPPTMLQCYAPKEENGNSTIPPILILDNMQKDKQSAQKLCTISKMTTKKRARRKARMGIWTQKFTG